jgi:DNA repair exonuclease SbcCD ATPase subunit
MDELHAEVEAERAKMQEAEAALVKSRQALDDVLGEVTEEMRALEVKVREGRDLARARQVHGLDVLRHQERLDKANAEMEGVNALVKAAQSDAATHLAEMAVLSTVEGVLGLKGVRAHVLSRALGGVEAVANSWLARIAGEGLRLRLKPYAEKADGGISDAISLEVEGAGGGEGYRAASTGERRRIDVALLLALSEVAAAAVGERPGTLWADEVFDGLDEVGVHAVCCALDALSAERAVVVITHNPLLSALLPNAHHVRL